MARQPQDLLHLLTRAERLAARRIQSVLDAFGCSVDAWRVLDLLSGDEGRNMTSLAEDAALPAPTLTKIVDQLVDQNLVFRRVDPADRRRVLAQLTPRGLRRRRELSRAVRAEWGPSVPGLTEDEEDQLLPLLGRLSGALADGSDREGTTTTPAGNPVGRAR
ncbi:MarR family winged helix-turn-helix transcriptional regulator [Streptomyces microflavus]|jgi:DNA-binding MarR family transcriptional regulator|uniref:MarR family winged helix-turn-helix transcriptional regulator n=1 Tax=Streptomyces TaxID=1883 RepID=UPI000823DC7A|nr:MULTISPECIES: MarR family transcriptional regulator [Streptomyces]MCX4651390.1 MarR family transcriptional regulator [Streptomyces microflavus]MDX2408273.1 MarR family transcriptional regulator [Streptomyces microflavus]WSA59780.1 MarR family transcriptional regulator [Streptomyces microflavus]SCK45225.1 DNA-binding transcriptional regulator, MarR family [Streptomyces sp. ScaeMP-e48]